MSHDPTCARAEELLSDLREGVLEEPLRGETASHLRSCAACRALLEELDFVARALAEYPDLAPSPTLAARAAQAALRAGKVRPFAPARGRERLVRLPAWAQSLAAGLALVTLGVLLLTTRSEAPARAAANIATATVRTGVYLTERKDRLIEDVRVLRVVIETAFEGRVEKVNERLDDYRKILERRRSESPGTHDTLDSGGAKKTNRVLPSFPNRRESETVTLV
jgi:hypothetical protein